MVVESGRRIRLSAVCFLKRTVLNSKPFTVEYKLTAYGFSLKPII
ncbi:winged helix-turn-helix transcriptional regulator [Pedobacter mendelii]